jgi:hypothetical protein
VFSYRIGNQGEEYALHTSRRPEVFRIPAHAAEGRLEAAGRERLVKHEETSE